MRGLFLCNGALGLSAVHPYPPGPHPPHTLCRRSAAQRCSGFAAGFRACQCEQVSVRYSPEWSVIPMAGYCGLVLQGDAVIRFSQVGEMPKDKLLLWAMAGPSVLQLLCCHTLKSERTPGRRWGVVPCCSVVIWGLILPPPEYTRNSLSGSVGLAPIPGATYSPEGSWGCRAAAFPLFCCG